MRSGGVASRITKSKQYKGQKPNNTKDKSQTIQRTKAKQYKLQLRKLENSLQGETSNAGRTTCQIRNSPQRPYKKQGQNDKIRANNISNQKSPAGPI